MQVFCKNEQDLKILHYCGIIAILKAKFRLSGKFYYLHDFTSHIIAQSCGSGNVVAVTLTPVEEKERQTDR